MGFLIRMGFWFSLVLLALPLGGKSETGEPQVGAIETFFAASEAIDDIAGLCERKPGVCETGKAALETVGVRARESAKIAYEVLDERFGEPDHSVSTGTIAVPQPRPEIEVAAE